MHDADEELMQALDADGGTRSPVDILAMVKRARLHGLGGGRVGLLVDGPVRVPARARGPGDAGLHSA